MPDDVRRRERVEQIIDCGAIGILRTSEPDRLVRAVEAIREGGIPVVEVAMTTPGALEVIEKVARRMSGDEEFLLGVGSVLDAEAVRRAVDAGARFVVSPIFKEEIVEVAHSQGVPVLPGAFSPTEIQVAHEAGADFVKVFPASILGKGYCSSVLSPLPHLRLVPTGGVSLAGAGEWIEGGASAVGVGSALLDKRAVAEGDFEQLTQNAYTLRRSIDEARAD